MIKKLLKSLREYKPATIMTMLCMVVEAGMEVLIPLLIFEFGKCVQPSSTDLSVPPNVNGMILYGCLMVGAAAISLIAGMLGGKFCATASAGFAKNLRHDVFENVQKFSFSNIDKFSPSSLVTRLTTDITNVQMSFMMIIRTAIRSPLMLVFSIVMSFSIHPTLPTVFFITVPFLTVGLFIIGYKAMPIFKKLFKRYDALNESVQENISGMRVVKAYVREDYESKKFAGVSNDLCREFTKAEKILAFNSPIMQISLHFALLALGFLGSRVIVYKLDPGFNTFGLQSLTTYSLQILMSLMMISMIFVMIIMSRASAERIVEVLDEKSNLTDDDTPVFDVKNGEIEFENVNFGYKNNLCLTDINLKIPSGATVGIIGGTGSGKSTLVQLIPRLYDVNSGSVKVGGKDVRSYDIEALRNSVAMVLQKNVLFSGTIKDNLRWGDKNATDEDIVRVCRLACADEFISSFPDKYDTYIEQGGSNVSGGQKQRLCIARALLKKPKILILDDSTSAVDTKTDSLIRKAFAEEIPDTTKLIIAQRISSVQNADMIVVLDGGKINAIGTHDELLESNEIYKEVYYSQQKGDDTNAGSDE